MWKLKGIAWFTVILCLGFIFFVYGEAGGAVVTVNMVEYVGLRDVSTRTVPGGYEYLYTSELITFSSSTPITKISWSYSSEPHGSISIDSRQSYWHSSLPAKTGHVYLSFFLDVLEKDAVVFINFEFNSDEGDVFKGQRAYVIDACIPAESVPEVPSVVVPETPTVQVPETPTVQVPEALPYFPDDDEAMPYIPAAGSTSNIDYLRVMFVENHPEDYTRSGRYNKTFSWSGTAHSITIRRGLSILLSNSPFRISNLNISYPELPRRGGSLTVSFDWSIQRGDVYGRFPQREGDIYVELVGGSGRSVEYTIGLSAWVR